MENVLKFVPLNADGSAPFVEVSEGNLELLYDSLTSRGYEVVHNMAFLIMKGVVDGVIIPVWDGRVICCCDAGVFLFSSAEEFLSNYPAEMKGN